MDWLKLLDDLKKKRGYNDVQLAKELGIAKDMLSHIRHGRSPMPPAVKFRIADRLLYNMAREELLMLLLPEALAEEIKESDNKRIQRNADAKKDR